MGDSWMSFDVKGMKEIICLKEKLKQLNEKLKR